MEIAHVIPGHTRPLDASHCLLCYAYHNSARYRAAVDGRPFVVMSTTSEPERCIHLGEELLAGEIRSVGLDPSKRTFVCRKGLGRVPSIAQPCVDCSPSCRAWSPGRPGGSDQDDFHLVDQVGEDERGPENRPESAELSRE